MKKMFLSVLSLLASVCLPAVAAAPDGGDDLYTDNVWNTECASSTRSDNATERPTLRLVREGQRIDAQLLNVPVNCLYGDITVDTKWTGQRLDIAVDQGLYGEVAACRCQISVYFTVYNVSQDEFELQLDHNAVIYKVGNVSFKDQQQIDIDLQSVEQEPGELNIHTKPVEAVVSNISTEDYVAIPTVTPQLSFNVYSDHLMRYLPGTFENYILPKSYNTLTVDASLTADSTLVVNLVTDGVLDGEGCKLGKIAFDVYNLTLTGQQLNVRVNHVTTKEGDNGEIVKETTNLYEGVQSFDQIGNLTIPLSNYWAGIASHTLDTPQTAGKLFDLQGRQVVSPQRGVYISNGKKVVVK